MFVCIALSFENSKTVKHECVCLCDSLISAALGLGKDIKKGKWFSVKHKILTIACHVLT